MVRVYTDGIFDLFHFGHSQYFKKIRDLYGSESTVTLIVGISSDSDTEKYKGHRPIMTHHERSQVVKDCRYVDQIVENAPWEIDDTFLNHHRIDWVVHEDVPYVLGASNGNDVYARVKELGKFQHMGRTPSISTSDIKKRILHQADTIQKNLEDRVTMESREENISLSI